MRPALFLIHSLFLSQIIFSCGTVANAEGKLPPIDSPQSKECTTGTILSCTADCDNGDDAACTKLQELYLRYGGTRSERSVKHAQLVMRLCEQGRKTFCPNFAFALAVGDGISQDIPRAKQLFVSTCSFNPSACGEFGNLYINGLGVKKDIELGKFLLTLACKERDANSCKDLESIQSKQK